MAKKINDGQIKEMLSEYKNGVPLHEILEKYDLGATTFARYRNEYNVPANKSYAPHYNEEMQEKFNDVFQDSINERYTINTEEHLSNLKYNVDQHYFDKIDTSNKAYILGLLYSDGYLSKRQCVCTLSLQERDKSVLEKINAEMHNEAKLSLVPYHEKNENYQNQYALRIYGKQLYESLILHGCTPAKSLTLTFPTNLPMNLYKDFMRGMIDGDGNIVNRDRGEVRVRLTSTPRFCEVAKLLIETILKINCYIMINKRSNTNVDLVIAGRRQSIVFLNWIYDNNNAELYIERKHDQYMSIINYKSENSLSA